MPPREFNQDCFKNFWGNSQKMKKMTKAEERGRKEKKNERKMRKKMKKGEQ